ncbi:MAG: hypothetical protein EXR37_05320 [Limnohabitans sp.]|nr:hypothetical protein [Limnohabitans sp.]
MASALAEEQFTVMPAVLHANVSPLATRSQLQSMEKVLRGEIQSVEKILRGEIQIVEKTLRTEIKILDHNIRHELLLLEQRMVIKLGGMMVLSLGLLTTLTQLI